MNITFKDDIEGILLYSAYSAVRTKFIHNYTGVIFYVLGDALYSLVNNELIPNQRVIFKIAIQTFLNCLIYDSYTLIFTDATAMLFINLITHKK